MYAQLISTVKWLRHRTAAHKNWNTDELYNYFMTRKIKNMRANTSHHKQ